MNTAEKKRKVLLVVLLTALSAGGAWWISRLDPLERRRGFEPLDTQGDDDRFIAAPSGIEEPRRPSAADGAESSDAHSQRNVDSIRPPVDEQATPKFPRALGSREEPAGASPSKDAAASRERASKRKRVDLRDCGFVLVDAAQDPLPDARITYMAMENERDAIDTRAAQEWCFGFKRLDALLDEAGRRIDADASGRTPIGEVDRKTPCVLVRADAEGLQKYAFVNLAYAPWWTLTLEAPQRVTVRVRSRRGEVPGGVPLRLEAYGQPVWTGATPDFESTLEILYPVRDPTLRLTDDDVMSHPLMRKVAEAAFDFPCVSQPAQPCDAPGPEVALVLPETGRVTLEIESDSTTGAPLSEFVIVWATRPGGEAKSYHDRYAYRHTLGQVDLPFVEVGIDLHVALVPTGSGNDLWRARNAMPDICAKRAVTHGPTVAGQHVRRTVRLE